MITAEQIKAARKLLGWSQGFLARRAHTSASVVADAEKPGSPAVDTVRMERIQAALEQAGVVFTGSTDAVLTSRCDHVISAGQVRSARKLLGWSYATLAKKSHRSLIGVNRIEQAVGDWPEEMHPIVRSIQRALEDAGVEFVHLNGDKPTVRLKKQDPKS